MTQATQTTRPPDILEVIADLSNDEVKTPPRIARAMLDLLPDEVWSDPNRRWLDVASKTGVFLREATLRLMDGLAAVIPDEQERLEHILRNQMYGIAITELSALLSRRTLYCSKVANGPHSIVKMPTEAGNIWFDRIEHSYDTRERCVECGGVRDWLERGSSDNHAYAFIHKTGLELLKKEFGNMKFDVILGNPPYQLDDGGGGRGSSATPIYQYFVEAAIDMNPRYVLMITPSRWFAGGKGLDAFRDRMLRDRRLRVLVDYPKLYEPFPNVKIRGGVSYFLWDRDNPGPCRIQTMWDGKPLGEPAERFLDAYDVLVRRNEAVPILEKVRAVDGGSSLADRISSRKPFGLHNNVVGHDSRDGLTDPIKLYRTQRVSWIERSAVPQNAEWVDEWKVLITKAQGTSAAVERIFLSKPIVAEPGTACTETYLVAGRFQSEEEAQRFANYLRTRVVRFLISLRKFTQNAPRDVYAFVPDLPLDEEWTDEKLYARYGLTPDEQAFIEATVDEMDP